MDCQWTSGSQNNLEKEEESWRSHTLSDLKLIMKLQKSKHYGLGIKTDRPIE